MMSPTATKDLQRPLKGAALCACFGTTGAAAAIPFVPPFVDATASKLTTFPCKQSQKVRIEWHTSSSGSHGVHVSV